MPCCVEADKPSCSIWKPFFFFLNIFIRQDGHLEHLEALWSCKQLFEECVWEDRLELHCTACMRLRGCRSLFELDSSSCNNNHSISRCAWSTPETTNHQQSHHTGLPRLWLNISLHTNPVSSVLLFMILLRSSWSFSIWFRELLYFSSWMMP